MKSKEKEQLNSRITELMNQRDDWWEQFVDANKKVNDLEREYSRLSD